jgi:hypothetical protein
MISLCIDCVKAEQLKRLISEKGELVPECAVCGSNTVLSLNCEDNDFCQLFKTLIRYHYTEWEYNSHWGGVMGLSELFTEDNPILNWRENLDDLNIEEAVLTLTEKVYEKYDQGVSVFSGFLECGQRTIFSDSLREESSIRLVPIIAGLSKKNYFLLDNDGKALLVDHEDKITTLILEGKQFYRARKGYDSKKHPSRGISAEPHYSPYSGTQIGAPSPLLVGTGRMNRPGISFLYLASNRETAIAEIRPHPGEYISVGQFKATRELKVADFSNIDIYNFYKSDKTLDDFVFFINLNKLFSAKISPDNRNDYAITQFFSDVARQLGYDGLSFISSVGKGVNLTIFDPDLFEYVCGSAEILSVEGLYYQFKDLPKVSSDEEYYGTL